MYKVGIIGLGRIAVDLSDNHLRAYLECKDTEIIAVADSDARKLVKFTKYHTYTSYEEMAQREALDIISVCTPVETHSEITCGVAPLTRALYVEKPIATTLEDADKMIESCHKNNVILQVNHQRRFMPVRVRFSRDIENTGTHMFDRLRQLFGEFGGTSGNLYLFGNQKVEIEYIKGNEHIFEIDCVRSTEPMILKGVEHLVHCLDTHTESISSGEEARKSLELVLAFKEFYECH